MIRVCDYIAEFMSKNGVGHIFMVTGGGAMFINDGVANQSKLKYICNHHEQASAMAAVAYAKYKNSIGAVMLTTGCGGTNAMTGLLDAWQDNVPCFFISGQAKRKETVRNSGLGLRQIGVQEADIISFVESMTKYAVMVNDASEIRYHLEKALYLSKSGRPGPVWIDIPMDIQSALISPEELKGFNPSELKVDYKTEFSDVEIQEIYELLSKAKRPVIIAGNGIKLANQKEVFAKFIDKFKIPCVFTFLSLDLLSSDNDLSVGRIGIKGDRAGNFAMQNADLILSLGCRLSVPSTGYEYDLFAREAKVIVVDIDPVEHKKNTVKIDKFYNGDIKNFFSKINIRSEFSSSQLSPWIENCKRWKNKWPVCLSEYKNEKNGVNLYYFVNRLSFLSRDNDVFVSDAGSAYYVTSQSLKIKANQKYITSGAQADMGFTIPACIGACAANDNKDIIGITGDGSFQMNIQELQTIVHNKLPIKLFVWNNNGYLSIRATQDKFFNGRRIGTDSISGVSFPDIKKISDAYGIKYYRANSSEDLDETIIETLNYAGPVICEIISPENQPVVPTVSSLKKPDGKMVSKPLEDMFPFLDRDEFFREMIVKPVEE